MGDRVVPVALDTVSDMRGKKKAQVQTHNGVINRSMCLQCLGGRERASESSSTELIATFIPLFIKSRSSYGAPTVHP